ncbi:serine/threonine-protein kinase pelle-like [Topomyia yanbarensis]|uniref:serine/threonine-protein kinase pelle-like n=1 Tax=Topomyia yanbarensis TaxID=2498891 RepID=UPI00273C627B|nr:serine/threonine-protein kinase pelle-like [Topomyia yanbarensis]
MALPAETLSNPNSPSASHCVSGFSSNFVFIYDIPWMERKRLSALLDQEAKWVGLALRQMGYDTEDVEAIRRCCTHTGKSPSEQLLSKWGNLNHTLTELFVVLAKENLFNAMEVIKRFVEPKFHILIKKESDEGTYKQVNGPAVESNPVVTHTTDRNAESAQQREEFVQPEVIAQDAPGIGAVVGANPQAAVGRLPADNIAAITGGLPQFSYEELREATSNWSPANELGKGGFGIVYKGYFKHTFVAIKKIKGINTESARTELRQSFNELKYLNSCRHENVVPLFGCSFEFGEPCLVYQYMPGGSLDNRLFPKSSSVKALTMLDRVKIAKGTARGLQYLHTFGQKPIIHGDIKPGNILLDNTNEPKIGDFGLTRELAVSDSSMKVSRVYGTRPYIPREFITHRQLSTKVDSFSYGLVLYEIITGQRVYDEKRKMAKHLKDIVLHAAQSGYDIRMLMDRSLSADDGQTVNICKVLLKAGFSCTADDPEKRPEMVDVYKYLVEHLSE